MPSQPTQREVLITSPYSLPEKIVRFLFREEKGFPFNLSETLKFLSAIAIIKNRAFLDGFFDALVTKIRQSSQDPQLSSAKKEKILYSSLSYIAFSDPKNGAEININDTVYNIEKIQLTSGWFSGAYYAYGLISKNTPDAQPILVFKGTTFPTDGGFLVGLLADTRPHGAVGTQLYARGQQILQNWISRQRERTGKNVLCTGLSLGGAMSLHCHINQPDKVDFFAINPPSLTSREKRVYKRPTQTATTDRTLTVMHHKKDFIFYVGSQYLPDDTKLIDHGAENDSTFFAHSLAADCNTNSEDPVPQEYDNRIRRTILNILWKIIKPILFLIVLVCHAIALPVRLITQIIYKVREQAGQAAPSIEPRQSAPSLTEGSEATGDSTALILGKTAKNNPYSNLTREPCPDEFRVNRHSPKISPATTDTPSYPESPPSFALTVG